MRALTLAREGFEVSALSGDAAALEAAEAARAAEHESVRQRVRFMHGSPATMAFEPETFDTVILSDLLAHVTQPGRLLEQARTLLTDTGRIIVSVPLGYHPQVEQVNSFYSWDLLELIEDHFGIVSCDVIHDYLCVLACKPSDDQRSECLTPAELAAAKRKAAMALVNLQRRWSDEHRRLHSRNLKLTEELAQSKSRSATASEDIIQLREQQRDIERQLKATNREQQRVLERRLNESQVKLDTLREVLVRTQAMEVRLARSSAELPRVEVSSAKKAALGTARKSGGVLFFCTNGAGLGHLTRSLAVARRIRRIDPALPIYFLTSSLAIPLIARENMVGYHIPPQNEYGDQFNATAWNELLEQMLGTITAIHRPAILIYDGVSPYRGLLEIISQAGYAYTAMILRLRHKHDRLLSMVDKLQVFDELLFPSESDITVPPEFTVLNHRVFDPIIYLDRDELLPRNVARQRWNIAPDRKVVYVQLGAGNINDSRKWVSAALSVLGPRSDVEVVLAESPISKHLYKSQPGAHILSQYPNSLFFNAFDLAIAAVGYNTFHELMHFGIPSVLIPNQQTVTDDQMGRARSAEEVSAARVALEPTDLEGAISAFLQDDVRRQASRQARELVPNNGAMSVAQHILDSASKRIEAQLCTSAD